MIRNSHSTIHQAYLQALSDVWFRPEFKAAPRGLPIREILNYTFTVDQPVAEPIVTCDTERNLVIADYTAKEVELYDSCTNRVEDFAKASKFWKQLANPDGTVNSAYGYLIWRNASCGNAIFEHSIEPKYSIDLDYKRTPWQWCVESLKQDKDTRQAILRFSLPEHQWMGVKDFTCTMYGIFLIRENRLYLSMFMRSGDMVKGATYDWPWFLSLMDKMVDELKPVYPDLIKGTYTHTTNSLHIYEKDEKTVLKMLGGI
jgi:thymidylate synthase